MTEILPTSVSGDFLIMPLVTKLSCNFAVEESAQGCVYLLRGVHVFRDYDTTFQNVRTHSDRHWITQ